MNKAKSYKIALLIFAFVMFAFAMFTFLFPTKTVRAETVNATKYFDGTASDIEFKNGDLTASVSDGDTIKFKNPLVLNELELALKLSEEIKSVKISFGTESYLINGNVVSEFDPTADDFNADDLEIDNQVNHELVIYTDGSASKFNGVDGVNFDGENVSVYFSVTSDSFVLASLNNKNTGFFGSKEQAYKVKNVDKTVVFDIEITFTVENGATGEFALDYVDQNYKNVDGKHKQDFDFDTSFSLVSPRVVLDDSAFVFDGEKYTARAVVGWLNTYSATVYSIAGAKSVESLTYTAEENGANIYVSGGKEPQICFNEAGSQEIYVSDGENKLEKYTFIVSEPSALEEGENKAPQYIDAQEAGIVLETYKQALLKATYAECDGKIANVRLGENVKVPDMRNLVYDDHTSYADMSHTLYYRTPNTSSSTSGWNIPLDKPGLYEFYVVFEDGEGNSMESENFYKLEEDELVKGEYYPYVFSFEIVDDAPIKITALAQSRGYIGTTYTISSFRIEGSDYTTVYELFYNKNQSAPYDGNRLDENWVSIPALADADENDVYPEGLTYDDVVAIAYNGSLSFTPNKIGAYAIRCTVTAKASGKTESATSVVKVNDRPKVVKVDNKWLRNNIWSVAFLSVGTLCLAGVVVLLFVKPKDEIK